ncbi:Methylenetetrahydrofolate reductase [Tindallia magadiensis]|uniref:Methylenetetrahydrofolate reductase n=1 Tax=Tindallia magadiensis TaxID=69895 RepID=A0A1I3DQ51_9FIRM|nr:methylenetetrahydrofolate reductase [Tindallia magadiensis]SFH88860.1 Methylenetetrahydrofolate reductase [Tindallia magadiensis]
MLKEKIINRKSGILLYGLTPPKNNQPEDKLFEISKRQIDRIEKMDIDGLVLYDIQDEQERCLEERPFPYMKTVDPEKYSDTYLKALRMPKIIYKCVGKHSVEDLEKWVNNDSEETRISVFVGAATGNQSVSIHLPEAYEMASAKGTNFLLGGVAIPERHISKKNEHSRVINKEDKGCRFFVSQAVYNIEASKNFLSDYYYRCLEEEKNMSPMIFTLTPCGSVKTLKFMKWLGVSIPGWMENELIHSQDTLNQSLQLSKNVFEELLEFAAKKKIPIGCNVESVSIKKEEIDASIALLKDVRKLMG